VELARYWPSLPKYSASGAVYGELNGFIILFYHTHRKNFAKDKNPY